MCVGSSLRALGVCAIVLSLALATTSLAPASTIPYGDFSGTTVKFLNVSESSNDPLPLFGAPTVSGDSLLFTPLTFLSESIKGDVGITDSHLALTIAADPGNVLDQISLKEFGDFTLIGAPGDLATASVASPTMVTVVTPSGPQQLFANMIFERDTIPGGTPPNFIPSTGTFTLAADATNGTMWRGHLNLSLAGLKATQAIVSLDDILSTLATGISDAKIEKKGFDVTVTTTPIPEPTTLALLGMGLLGLAFIGWRKR